MMTVVLFALVLSLLAGASAVSRVPCPGTVDTGNGQALEICCDDDTTRTAPNYYTNPQCCGSDEVYDDTKSYVLCCDSVPTYASPASSVFPLIDPRCCAGADSIYDAASELCCDNGRIAGGVTANMVDPQCCHTNSYRGEAYDSASALCCHHPDNGHTIRHFWPSMVSPACCDRVGVYDSATQICCPDANASIIIDLPNTESGRDWQCCGRFGVYDSATQICCPDAGAYIIMDLPNTDSGHDWQCCGESATIYDAASELCCDNVRLPRGDMADMVDPQCCHTDTDRDVAYDAASALCCHHPDNGFTVRHFWPSMVSPGCCDRVGVYDSATQICCSDAGIIIALPNTESGHDWQCCGSPVIAFDANVYECCSGTYYPIGVLKCCDGNLRPKDATC